MFLYVQIGRLLGFDTELFGFFWPHPPVTPNRVSSTAASYAAPQFGSLYKKSDLCRNTPGGQLSLLPGATICTIKVRTNVMGETILGVGFP